MFQSVIKQGVIAAAVFALPLVMGSSGAQAFSYAKKLSNGKTCRVLLGQTHWHVGDAADASKAAAQAKARRKWSNFASFEYGRKYGKWAAADKRKMICLKDSDAGVWRCRAEAQPCKG